MAEQHQSVLPQLGYDDPGAAVAWLCDVFGFVETWRLAAPDETLLIATLRVPSGGNLMVGGQGGVALDQARAELGSEFRAADARPWPNLAYSITVMVDDVDAHCDAARAAGARIMAAPRDQPWGYRDYEVIDLEGRQWNFSQQLHETRPEDWGASASE